MAGTPTLTFDTPPHSLEAEKTVLGALLLDPEAIIKISDFLKPEDFYDPTYRTIYSAIFQLYNNHEAIDFITVSNRLADNKAIQQIGGSAFLADLASSVPTSSHIYQYGQIVKAKALHRSIIDAGRRIVGLGYETDTPVPELLDAVERTIFQITNVFMKDKFVHIKDILDSRYEKFAELHASDDSAGVKGVPTGFNGLDFKLSGLQPSDLIILAARPSMGKTSLAMNIAVNAAVKHRKTVGVFSLEMSKEQLVDRLFASMLGVDSWKLQRGKLDDSDFQNMGPIMDDLAKANIFVDDSSASSLTEFRTKARRLQMEHGLDLLVIDYLQLMQGPPNLDSREQQISAISRGLKQIAKELNVPVLALSQLNRGVESRQDKRPMTSDLRESGAIEQDADVIMFIYRDEVYNPETPDKGVAEIIIAKQRNGPTGTAKLRFFSEYTRYENLAVGRE